MAFDYIVVGAGSAGCACAARLVDLLPGDARVALIESGEDFLGRDSQPSHQVSEHQRFDADDFSIPERFPKTWTGPADRGYRTVAQEGLNDRRISLVRAAAVGGCSTVNAMIWMRGFKEDWDENMPPGLRSDDIEEEFEWLEDRIRPVRYGANFLGERGIQAAEALGYEKAGKDDSLWESPGTSGHVRIALDSRGRRQDIYRALGAIDGRITLLRGTAETLIFEQHPASDAEVGTKGSGSKPTATFASGVRLKMEDGSYRNIIVKGEGEVILSCGAIDTPKLLQLSGIGPEKVLNELGIPLVLDSPGVGEGLKDHVMYPMVYETSDLPEKLSPNGINAILYDESLDVQFLFTDGSSSSHMLVHQLMEPLREKMPSSSVLGKAKDAAAFVGMSLLSLVLRTMSDWSPGFRTRIQSNVGILVNVMKPRSVGSVRIASTDPSDPPMIDPAYFSDERDMDTMVKGVAKVKELVRTNPFSGVAGKELTPSLPEAVEEMKEKIRENSTPYHHSTGTCASCLDDQLRFKGIGGLRIADASSLPFQPRVPTNASCMAVGTRCASLIASRQD